MHEKRKGGLFGILFICILTVFILILIAFRKSHAQERSGEILQQLERKEVIPEKKPSEPPVIEKEKVEEKVKVEEKDERKIFVRQFAVQGVTLIEQDVINAIITPHQNKELTLRELSSVAEAITNEYRKRGYIIAYAYIPAQDIKDGIVGIKVIEGKVGDILVSGNKHYSTGFIQKHLEKTRKDPSLKEQALERQLLILNDNPSLSVKTSLKAGKEPATADIIASAQDEFPISGSITYDNFGSATISKHRAGINLNIGNLATSGDYLMFRGLTGLDRIDIDKLSYGRLEYLIPIDYNGTKLGLYYANSIYEAGEQYTILNIHGKAHVAGLYAIHPLIRQRDKTLSIRAGFEYKDVYDYMLDSLRSKDNIRVFNASINYDFFDALQGRNIIGFSYYQGIRDLFGGNASNDSDSSRLNADGQFSKYTLDLVRVQRITDYSHIILRGSGQISGDALFSAEQFYIGGIGTVRGFKPSLYGGDSGYLLGAELHISPLFPEKKILNRKVGDAFKFVMFVDHGGIYRNDVQPGENKDDHLTSVGAGIRFYEGKYFSLRMDWAVPEINGKFNTGNSMTYMQATMNF
jgi:hemolysin activation/secretion protein